MTGETLKVSQVAFRVGRHQETIKRLERAGVLPAPKRDRNGYRYYTEQDVERIRAILYPQSSAAGV